jgi:hypothetical protein
MTQQLDMALPEGLLSTAVGMGVGDIVEKGRN